MIREKLFFVVCAAWEVVRFAAIFAILTVQPGAPTAAVYSVIALWFGSGQLILAAAMVMLGLFPARYRAYLPLIRLGKLLSFAPAILAIVIGVPVTADIGLSLTSVIRAAAPIVILGVDSILFVFLLSYRISAKE